MQSGATQCSLGVRVRVTPNPITITCEQSKIATVD